MFVKPDNCKICSSTNLNFRFSYNEYKIFCCKACNHRFIYPIPGESFLKKYYNTNKKGLHKTCSEDLLYDYKKNPKYAYLFKKNILSQISKYIPKKKNDKFSIFEFGCGSGVDLSILKNFYKQKRVSGFDIDEETVNLGRNLLKLNLYSGHLSKIIKKKKKFNLIYSFHTIEHLSNPVKQIKLIYKLLRKNGILVINCPNSSSFTSYILGKKWQWLIPPAHIHYFTTSSLKRTLMMCGFKDIKISTGQNYFPGGYIADLHRIFLRFFFNKKQETDLPLHLPSNYKNKFLILVVADIFFRLLTLPFLLLMKLSNSGSVLMATAKK